MRCAIKRESLIFKAAVIAICQTDMDLETHRQTPAIFPWSGSDSVQDFNTFSDQKRFPAVQIQRVPASLLCQHRMHFVSGHVCLCRCLYVQDDMVLYYFSSWMLQSIQLQLEALLLLTLWWKQNSWIYPSGCGAECLDTWRSIENSTTCTSLSL